MISYNTHTMICCMCRFTCIIIMSCQIRKLKKKNEQEEGSLINEDQNRNESIFDHKNWTLKQKIRLMIFFQFYQGIPDWTSERRSIHLYKYLSQFLKKARTPEQCKNIHSLLKRKFLNFNDINTAIYEELSSNQNYEKLVAKYYKEIQKFEDNIHLYAQFQMAPPSKPFKFTKSEMSGRPKEKKSGGSIKESRMEEKESLEMLRGQLVNECNFYFREWLKAVNVLAERKLKQKFNDLNKII